jgi:hypothetical protein
MKRILTPRNVTFPLHYSSRSVSSWWKWNTLGTLQSSKLPPSVELEREPPDHTEGKSAVYSDAAPSEYQIIYGLNSSGGQRIQRRWPHWPVEQSTSEMCQKIKDLLMQDRRSKVWTISRDSVCRNHPFWPRFKIAWATRGQVSLGSERVDYNSEAVEGSTTWRKIDSMKRIQNNFCRL